jgi:hypothetical protein
MGTCYANGTRRRLLAGDEPRWLAKHPRRAYLVKLILATPEWVDRRALRAVAKEAKRRTLRAVNQRYVSDHIVPLTHKLVCGLNVPWNLRVITWEENARRSNAWWEFTEDMFQEPEQLSLRLMGSDLR